MSSNQQHITPVLTRDNYEEYFLLYVDNELTPDEKKAVETFVLQHPDLKEELDLLCSTKLPADALSFENKDELFADSMKVNAVDESLLLYIDNELPAWETEIVEAELKRNESFAQQHQLLLKTKLDAREQILYPDKKELYRHTEKRIAPYWLRVAAAVLLVAGAGTAAWLAMDNSKDADPVVAVIAPNKTPQPAPITKEIKNPIVEIEGKTVAANKESKLPKKTLQPAANTLAVVKPKAKKKIIESTFSKAHTAENKVAIAAITVDKKRTADNLKTSIRETEIKTPSFNNKDVTSETAATYVSIDAAAKTLVPVHAVAQQNNTERSGGAKAFLRKATRFIERRTGIKAVNDDDELLVGVVALKL